MDGRRSPEDENLKTTFHDLRFGIALLLYGAGMLFLLIFGLILIRYRV